MLGVRAAAAELGHRINLVDALGIVLLMAARKDGGYERAAAKLLVMAEAAVLLAEGRPGEAAVSAAAARAAADHAPLTAARAGLIEGRALAAAGQRQAARATLVKAERALDGFGARRWRDEAVRALRGLGHRVRRPARGGAAGPLGPLTAREREIAGLVVSGRTNREIAAELVLSQRTIEAHLRNIYAKLGVRSRVELTRTAQYQP